MTQKEEMEVSKTWERIEEVEEKLRQIIAWTEAYPLQIFPEPDFHKAAKVLKENGMTLDSIAASNMRHVLSGIKNIIKRF